MVGPDTLDQLERLHRLFQAGALSEAEYNREKERLLDSAGSTPPPPSSRDELGLRLRPLVPGLILAALLLVLAIWWISSRAAGQGAQPGSSNSANRPATDNRLPPNSVTSPGNAAAPQAPQVVKAAPKPPVDLSIYAGAYPSDRVVGGSSFIRDPAVRSALNRVVKDRKVRNWVLSDRATATPVETRGRLVRAWACEPHNCGPHHWVILIDRQGRSADVCYFNADASEYSATWYLNNGRTEVRGGECPE